jgi:endonuclease/exonuclease/phosphatase family metal-dependent hydrolase
MRLMAANLTSGNLQSYDPGEGIRLVQGVHPDVVMLQETNYKTNSAADYRSLTDQMCGTDCSFFVETGAQIPNAVISRFPILASGKWEDTASPNREFAWAKLQLPGPHPLWVVSVHLLTANASTRNGQATQLVGYLQANVAAGDYVAVGGDFNTDNNSEPCLSTLSSLVANPSPYPADQKGNVNTNSSRGKPYDKVLVDSVLGSHRVATVVGTSTYANGLVLDTRVYTPLSDVAPALLGDSSSSNMQHMGVVKDFLVPAQ